MQEDLYLMDQVQSPFPAASQVSGDRGHAAYRAPLEERAANSIQGFAGETAPTHDR
jgi:hypothetical protein